MTDLQRFIQAGAKLMHADRPDLWKSEEDALATLVKWFSDINGEVLKIDGKPVDCIGSGGFELRKYTSPGEEYEGEYTEYALIRQLVDLSLEANGEDSSCFDWTTHGQVFNVGELGID